MKTQMKYVHSTQKCCTQYTINKLMYLIVFHSVSFSWMACTAVCKSTMW